MNDKSIMRTSRASTLIAQDDLNEPHVLLHRSEWDCVLCPLDKVLAAARAFANDTHDVVLIPARTYGYGALTVDHLSRFGVGDVVSFHILPSGLIQSRKYTLTEAGHEAIRLVLSANSCEIMQSEQAGKSVTQ